VKGKKTVEEDLPAGKRAESSQRGGMGKDALEGEGRKRRCPTAARAPHLRLGVVGVQKVESARTPEDKVSGPHCGKGKEAPSIKLGKGVSSRKAFNRKKKRNTYVTGDSN